MDRIKSFEPIIGHKPKVLILGSMPSATSLENSEYYGFGRNQFWKIMGELFGFERNESYEIRKKIIEDKGVAVWDVLKSCERVGSLDKNITNEDYNDIAGFIKEHPSITHIVLNGGKARDVYKKQFQSEIKGVEVVTFYSTSPANAIAYDLKFAQWQEISSWLSNNIVLIGMPGAGKSTIGVVLAKTIGMRFIDTDLVIQDREDELLQTIIDRDGMDAFIEVEENAVMSVEGRKMIIATGGSVVYSESAMKHLKSLGPVVYLDVSYEEIDRRVNNITTRGIAIRDGATLRDVYEERSELYNKYYDIRILCDNLTVEETISKIIEQL